MFERYEVGTCWWCGAEADSREHRVKKSDLAQEFGRGPYVGRDATVMSADDGKLLDLQGPKAKLAKFQSNLCQPCNNARSQPFDRAYERFTKYVKENEQSILAAAEIDLCRVFGSQWPSRARQLTQYLVKHVGCRLAESGVRAPQLASFLDGGVYPSECFALDVEIRSDIVEMGERLRSRDIPDGSLWIGQVIPIDGDGDGDVSAGLQSFLGYRWLRFYWGVGLQLDGYPDPFSVRRVRLGSGAAVRFFD